MSIITRDRTDELRSVLESIGTQSYGNFEVIIGDNGSTPQSLGEIRRICLDFPMVRLVEFNDNLGVAGGRNAVLRHCRGEYVIELDDDGLLAHKEIFSIAARRMNELPEVGILAFKIVNYHKREIERGEYPFLQKNRDPEMAGETTWFIGCGHVFRRALLDRIQGYQEFFPYGAEELDFAFRALDAGFRIFYEPALMVWHKKSLKHRIVDPVAWGALCLKHRLKVALLNLPVPMCLTYLAGRGFLYSGKLRHPSVIPRALRMLWSDRSYIRQHRRVLRWSTMQRILALRGPLFF